LKDGVLGPSFLFTHDGLLATTKNKMIKRTIKITKPLKKVFPEGLPARVHVESVDTVLNNDTADTVNKWISERRENAAVEKANSRSMILAWRTKRRLRIERQNPRNSFDV